MDLTTLTYLNSLVIIVALVIMGIILYAIRREQADLLLRIDERSNTIASANCRRSGNCPRDPATG